MPLSKIAAARRLEDANAKTELVTVTLTNGHEVAGYVTLNDVADAADTADFERAESITTVALDDISSIQRIIAGGVDA